jgi:REP element-mobilizing transposase RayT
MQSILRKDIRLPSDRYVGQRIYFVTICCENRVAFFEPPRRCHTAVEALKRVSGSMHFLIHVYCIMPDHTRLLAEGTSPDANLVRFVARWKQSTGYLLREESLTAFGSGASTTGYCVELPIPRRWLGTFG